MTDAGHGRAGRLDFLDQLRAVAILLVLVSHYGIAIDANMAAAENRSINIGIVGVFVFFCVSGYVIPWSMRGKGGVGFVTPGVFWKRRLLRLYPIYILASAVGLLWLGDDTIRRATVAAFTREPVTYSVLYALMQSYWFRLQTIFDGLEWTLAYEMVFYVACTVFLVAKNYLRNKTTFIAVVAVLCGLTILPDLVNVGNDIQKTAFMYLFFLFGFIFFLRNTGHISARYFAVAATAVAAAIVLRNALWYSYWGMNYMTMACVPGIFIFYAFASRRIIVESRLLSIIGTVSYSTYLTHIFIPHHIPLSSFPWGVRFFAWTALAVAVSVPLYFYVELPFIRAGRRSWTLAKPVLAERRPSESAAPE